MKKIIILLTLLSVSIPAVVQAQSLAAKLNLGSTGLGGELAYQVSDPLNVRLGGNFLSASYLYESDADDEFDIDSSLNLGMINALADWHPFGNSFRLTGGLVYNNNTIDSELIPKQTYTLGGDTYTADDLGRLQSEFSFNAISPFIGLGFGNVFKGSRFGVNAEIGMIYQGEPEVELRGDGALAPSAEQAPILQDNLSWATIYPVLNFSLYYRIKS